VVIGRFGDLVIYNSGDKQSSITQSQIPGGVSAKSPIRQIAKSKEVIIMTIFKTIIETAKTAARHPVTREIVKAAFIIIIKKAFEERRRRGR